MITRRVITWRIVIRRIVIRRIATRPIWRIATRRIATRRMITWRIITWHLTTGGIAWITQIGWRLGWPWWRGRGFRDVWGICSRRAIDGRLGSVWSSG